MVETGFSGCASIIHRFTVVYPLEKSQTTPRSDTSDNEMSGPMLASTPRGDGSRYLNCLIEGESGVFPVTVALDYLISRLKEDIQSKAAHGTLKSVDAYTLELCKEDTLDESLCEVTLAYSRILTGQHGSQNSRYALSQQHWTLEISGTSKNWNHGRPSFIIGQIPLLTITST